MADSFVINVSDAHAWEHSVSGTLDYPTSELAARYGAATPEPTDNGDVAYSDWPWDLKDVTAPWPPA